VKLLWFVLIFLELTPSSCPPPPHPPTPRQMFIAAGEWDQANEMCQRVTNASTDGSTSSDDNFEAIMINTLIDVVHQGKDVKENFQRLLMSLSRNEPNNAKIHFEMSRLFARLSGRNRELLQMTVKLVSNACELEPKNSEYVAEKGYQYRLMGNYGMALDTYKDASRIDESNVEASYGMIYCQLMQGQVEDAEQQLEFLSVIQGSDGSNQSASLTFLKALIALRKDKNAPLHLKLLNLAVEQHEQSQRENPASDIFLIYYNFNPDFLVEIAKVSERSERALRKMSDK